MGGTSTDVSTVIGGKESFTTAFEIEWGVPIQIPMIDIRTIGAGGGSIAWIDKGGMLRVGPQSAGAKPGPACYGRGGTEATVTDANLVLGRINPDNFLGGRMTLDADAARAGRSPRVAEPLGQRVEETALAIVRIADNNMVGALRSVLIERGLDPRDFTLCAFGGAGPLHASDLMREMGIPRAIVPNHPGQFSAYGFILTDARVDRQRTTQLTSQALRRRARQPRSWTSWSRRAWPSSRRRATATASRSCAAWRCAISARTTSSSCRSPSSASTDDAIEQLWQRFHDAHEARFGFSIPGEIIEIVNYHGDRGLAHAPSPSCAPIAKADGHAGAEGAARRCGSSDGPARRAGLSTATTLRGGPAHRRARR